MRGERIAVAVMFGLAPIAAAIPLLLGEGPSALLLLIIALGPPMAVLLFVLAVVGPAADTRPVWPSVLLGATLMPVFVLVVPAAMAVAAFLLIQPLRSAGTELLDLLQVEPTLLALLRSPWAIAFLVGLTLVLPLTAETLKPLGSVLRKPGSRVEAYVFGVAAGAGFAVTESILFATGGWFSHEGWLEITVLRSSGAAIHMLLTGLVSLALFEARADRSRRALVAKALVVAVAVHAMWNGAVAAALVLFNARTIGSGGIGDGSLTPGVALEVFLGFAALTMFVVLLGVSSRIARGSAPQESLGSLSMARPATIVAWALFAGALLIPGSILILVFPEFLSL